MQVIVKLAAELKVGDVVIGGIAHPPSLHYMNGEPVLHHTEVIAVEHGQIEQEAYHPLFHLPDGEVRRRVDEGRADELVPQVDIREFPAVRVVLAGFENFEQHPVPDPPESGSNPGEQLPIERIVSPFEVVHVLDGDLKAFLSRDK